MKPTLLKKITFLFVLTILIFSCVPPKDEAPKEVNIDFKDITLRRIIDFQDEKMTDSLITYLNSPNPTYRYAAVNAFASIKDGKFAKEIAKRLKDDNREVREIAAFSLGQMGNAAVLDSLIAVYGKYDTTNHNNNFNAAILETVGKIGDEGSLKNLSTISSFRPSDTLLLLGQTRGLYQYMLRGMSTPEGTEKIIDNIGGIYPKDLKVVSSYYILKAKQEDLNNYAYRLIKLFERENDVNVKMNIAIGLGKTKKPEALKALKKALKDKNTDDRVKVNIIKAFQNFDYADVVETILPETENPNWKIAFSAADYFYNFGTPKDAPKYRKYAKKELNWRVKSMLYRAALKHIPVYFSKTKSAIVWEIKKQIENSENPFEKAQYILALGEDIKELNSIYEYGFKAPETVPRTASMEALSILVNRKEIENLSKRKLQRLKKEIVKILSEALESKDAGIIYFAADILYDSKIDFKDEFGDMKLIDECKKRLKSPEDKEAIMELEKLQAKWEGKKYVPTPIKFNNKIDWKIIDTFSRNPIVTVETSKGDFKIELLKDKAPGTVVNFIKLIRGNYFEGKKVHRVVPNFVIQTGCNRGDGFGSLNYTIRSELNDVHYSKAGLVGMASAGNDTESSQWFVTLTPTPHLNGKYTVFGKVVSGLDIVENIEIGDIINSVKLVR